MPRRRADVDRVVRSAIAASVALTPSAAETTRPAADNASASPAATPGECKTHLARVSGFGFALTRGQPRGPHVDGVVRAECASNAHDMAVTSGGDRPYRRATWAQCETAVWTWETTSSAWSALSRK